MLMLFNMSLMYNTMALELKFAVFVFVVSAFCEVYGLEYLSERPVCPPQAGNNCVQGLTTMDEYMYTINGKTQAVSFSEGDYFFVLCAAAEISDPSFPRFPRLFRFSSVTLKRCAPPTGSIADALLALNVSVLGSLKMQAIPSVARITVESMAHLQRTVTELVLNAERKPALRPEPNAFAQLSNLKTLKLDLVHPDRLPLNLRRLELRDSDFDSVSEEALATVEELVVSQTNILNVTLIAHAKRLRVLSLNTSLRTLPQLSPTIRNLTLSRWQESEPTAWRDCPELLEISISLSKIERLPAGWVEECGKLASLSLRHLWKLSELPAELLRGAAELRQLTITNTAITRLPDDLFLYTPKLRELLLDDNKLTSLPSGIFSTVVRPLRKLGLAKNRLSGESLAAVAVLSRLESLSLAGNPLGDLCPAGSGLVVVRGTSPLAPLQQLQFLSLSSTGAARLCADWLRGMLHLTRLDLTHNSITEVQFEELEMLSRNQNSELDLTSNPLTLLTTTVEDYRAPRQSSPYETAVLVSGRFACDCRMYWAARALRRARLPGGLQPQCAGGRPLRRVPLRELACPVEPPLCPPECTCAVVPAAGADDATRNAVTAQCRGDASVAALLAALAADPGLELRELRLAPAAARLALPPLPASLRFVDLSFGNLSRGDDEFVERLFAAGRRVRLVGSPIDCGCGDGSLVDALRDRAAQVEERAAAKCADGRALAQALGAARCSARALGPALGALAALGAGALAAAALAALLASPELRLRLKALLHARGVRARWLTRRLLADGDAGRHWDAYVTHAEADARFVAEQLLPRLEPRYRVCVAYRDWPVGAWIPAQIEASVRGSRRTVALVTPRLLRCDWARAALRAALAASLRERAPRLLLLLAGVDAAALEPPLRAYAAAHTALRWGERWFWEKLMYALPDPRPA